MVVFVCADKNTRPVTNYFLEYQGPESIKVRPEQLDDVYLKFHNSIVLFLHTVLCLWMFEGFINCKLQKNWKKQANKDKTKK